MAKANLQPIIDEVDRLTTVRASVEALLARLSQAVLDAPTLAEAQEVARSIQAEHDAFTAAVVAHTPAEDEVEE